MRLQSCGTPGSSVRSSLATRPGRFSLAPLTRPLETTPGSLSHSLPRPVLTPFLATSIGASRDRRIHRGAFRRLWTRVRKSRTTSEGSPVLRGKICQGDRETPDRQGTGKRARGCRCDRFSSVVKCRLCRCFECRSQPQEVRFACGESKQSGGCQTARWRLGTEYVKIIETMSGHIAFNYSPADSPRRCFHDLAFSARCLVPNFQALMTRGERAGFSFYLVRSCLRHHVPVTRRAHDEDLSRDCSNRRREIPRGISPISFNDALNRGISNHVRISKMEIRKCRENLSPRYFAVPWRLRHYFSWLRGEMRVRRLFLSSCLWTWVLLGNSNVILLRWSPATRGLEKLTPAVGPRWDTSRVSHFETRTAWLDTKIH